MTPEREHSEDSSEKSSARKIAPQAEKASPRCCKLSLNPQREWVLDYARQRMLKENKRLETHRQGKPQRIRRQCESPPYKSLSLSLSFFPSASQANLMHLFSLWSLSEEMKITTPNQLPPSLQGPGEWKTREMEIEEEVEVDVVVAREFLWS